MKRRTYNNVLKTTKAIAAQGYDWETANAIAMKYWDNFEFYGMTVESQLARLAPREQFEREAVNSLDFLRRMA